MKADHLRHNIFSGLLAYYQGQMLNNSLHLPAIKRLFSCLHLTVWIQHFVSAAFIKSQQSVTLKFFITTATTMDNVVFFFFLFKSPLPAAALSLKQHHHSRSPPHHYLFILFMTQTALFHCWNLATCNPGLHTT